MPDPVDLPDPSKRPKKLLTQNHELRDIGAYNWTLPAFVVQLSNGKHFNVCPSAGVCASVCYARNGAFNYPSVKQAHVANLEWVLYDLDGWRQAMTAECSKPKYRGKHIRIHDSGDFFSDEYLLAWLRIARDCPDPIFYCYTKEVDRFRRIVENRDGEFPDVKPDNFRYLYSFGGKQDTELDEQTDRVADVFPSFEAMDQAGYSTQHVSDLQAIYNENNRVGIPYNNIPGFKKQMAGRTFQQMQHEQRARLDARKLPEDERAAVLEALTTEAEQAALCPCGQPYAGKPGDGCKRWGHSTSRSADTTQTLMQEAGEVVPQGDAVPTA